MTNALGHFIEGAKGWLNAGLAFIYPEVCDICSAERATPAEGFVCQKCREKVQFIAPPFCRYCGLPYDGEITVEFQCGNCRDVRFAFAFARSAVLAQGPVLEAIHGYKYNNRLWFESFLAELLLARALQEIKPGDWDLVVPTPLHPTKYRERGFNQAEQLARKLAKALNLPLRADSVRRVAATPTQTRLDREQRRANMRKAFAPARRLDGARVILVDDVFTTGATTSACSGALVEAGASSVCVWTVARGI